MDILHTIYQILHRIGIRKIGIMLVVLISVSIYFKERKQKRKRPVSDKELEKIYEKDENGLFPWEIHTNDSPKDIPENAKRYHYEKSGPRRGRW